ERKRRGPDDAARERLRPEHGRDGDPAPSAPFLSTAQPRLRGEERLLHPIGEESTPLAGLELCDRPELGARGEGHQRFGIDAFANGLEPGGARLRLERLVLADQEDGHQYLPITRPPSTRRYVPVV